MSDVTERLAQLREPFPPAAVGQLPKISCSDCSKRTCTKHSKAKCKVCDNWITSAHVHLDYVGHAAVTDRLLKVDPEWTWEPLALTDKGLPVIEGGALWIKLTVCGVTRLGVGDASGKNGPDAMKEMIGDALRNAAMRFGVAIDLWSKGDLQVESEPEPAPDDVVGHFKARLNVLPAECRKEFREHMCHPDHLRADQVANALLMIIRFEREAAEAAKTSTPEGSGHREASEHADPVLAQAEGGTEVPSASPEANPPAGETYEPAYTREQFDQLLTETGIPAGKAMLRARRLAESLGAPVPSSLDAIAPGQLLDALVAAIRSDAA